MPSSSSSRSSPGSARWSTSAPGGPSSTAGASAPSCAQPEYRPLGCRPDRPAAGRRQGKLDTLTLEAVAVLKGGTRREASGSLPRRGGAHHGKRRTRRRGPHRAARCARPYPRRIRAAPAQPPQPEAYVEKLARLRAQIASLDELRDLIAPCARSRPPTSRRPRTCSRGFAATSRSSRTPSPKPRPWPPPTAPTSDLVDRPRGPGADRGSLRARVRRRLQ